MPDDLIAEIAAHRPIGPADDPLCEACGHPWPCLVRRLADRDCPDCGRPGAERVIGNVDIDARIRALMLKIAELPDGMHYIAWAMAQHNKRAELQREIDALRAAPEAAERRAERLAAVLVEIRAQMHVQEHGGYIRDAAPAAECFGWICADVNRALADTAPPSTAAPAEAERLREGRSDG